ncbi:hypothetical protein BDQ17DRAFT_1321704 [Cyathus striatus]|nr:hypothetical protein BDQ17DRAFT_1321704 [Cyathus striatus]
MVGDRVTVLAPLGMHEGNIVIVAKQQKGVVEEGWATYHLLVVDGKRCCGCWGWCWGSGTILAATIVSPVWAWVGVWVRAWVEAALSVFISIGGGGRSNVGPAVGLHNAGRRQLEGPEQRGTGGRRQEVTWRRHHSYQRNRHLHEAGKERWPVDVASTSLHRGRGGRRENWVMWQERGRDCGGVVLWGMSVGGGGGSAVGDEVASGGGGIETRRWWSCETALVLDCACAHGDKMSTVGGGDEMHVGGRVGKEIVSETMNWRRLRGLGVVERQSVEVGDVASTTLLLEVVGVVEIGDGGCHNVVAVGTLRPEEWGGLPLKI